MTTNIAKPTPEDLVRNLAADLEFIKDKNELAQRGKFHYDVGDDVDVAERARVEDAWPAAIRRALAAEAEVRRLQEIIDENLP